MVTGSLCFPLFLDISPFGGWFGTSLFSFFLDISPFGEDSDPLIRRTSINPIVGRTAKTSSV